MNTVITIGRQFGSGGREIGEKIAAHFGIKCYDKELLTRAAKESGFCEEMLANHDERPTNSFLYNLVMDTYSFGYNASSFVDMPISQKVFLAQFDTIKKVASEGNCIIVGRCAEYILRERKDVVSVFLHADDEYRMNRVINDYGIVPKNAAKEIKAMDKKRAKFHNFYSDDRWGDASTYDLSINVAKLGIDETVELIANYISAKF